MWNFQKNQSFLRFITRFKVKGPAGDVILEVVKHLDQTKVKAISLQSTDGLQRGAEVEDTENQILVPVGPEVLGHIFDVCGNLLEGKATFKKALANSQSFSCFYRASY